MPDLSSLTLPELVEYLKTGAWLVWYAVLLRNTLEHLRNPGYYTGYSKPVAALAVWVQDLDPLQMQLFSIAAFFVPTGVVALIVHFVPYEWWIAAQPVFAWLVYAAVIYTGQQLLHLKVK